MSFTIGAQYYRPPFPLPGFWKDDIARMRDAGLNAIQLWMVWGWIEAVPGTFDFSDYDALLAEAEKRGLKIVLSTIAAIHPLWIHREVPDSEMVTNMGLKVISTSRREVHFGLTPGGCFDHPGIAERMGAFLDAAATRYAGTEAVTGWDVWNELRWNVHADGLVCYCDHTVAAFRTWLEERYGSLAALNDAWHRRYQSWDEVQPGKRPGRVYTEMMAFSEFMSAHLLRRYHIVKGHDPGKPVTLHGGKPTILYGVDSYHGDEQTTTLHRGNDWGFAEVIDGVGTSSFPVWEKIDLTNFTSRIDFVRAAAVQQRWCCRGRLGGVRSGARLRRVRSRKGRAAGPANGLPFVGRNPCRVRPSSRLDGLRGTPKSSDRSWKPSFAEVRRGSRKTD